MKLTLKNDYYITLKNNMCIAKIVKFLEWQNLHAEEFGDPPKLQQGEREDELQEHQTMPIKFDSATLIDKLNGTKHSPFAKILALRKELNKYHKYIGRWQAHFTRQQERQTLQQLKQFQNNTGSMCNAVKQSTSAPITRINCGTSASDGKAKQRITTDPAEIDAALQGIWGRIHAGNLGPHASEECGKHFLRQYGDYFQFQDEMEVNPLTAEDLKKEGHPCVSRQCS